MTRIKIISNPYQKKIGYQHWNESSKMWATIGYESHSNLHALRWHHCV